MSSMPYDPSDCWPLSLTRAIEDFPIANLPLTKHQHRLAAESGVAWNPNAWLDPVEFASFIASGKMAFSDAANQPLAWRGTAADATNVFVAKHSFVIRYPWDFIRANESYITALDKNSIQGEVHPLAVIEGIVHIGPGTRILPGVFIEGNVVIGANCKIGPNCYIRGNTSIGDQCHIGQSVEIKNCLILSQTNIGHLSYIGDSVLGEKVNLGAGTTTSNLRHDGKNHRSMVHGVLVDTGRRKFGAIIGDQVHTGIHTSIYPGRKLWSHTNTRPGDIVQHDLHSIF